MKKTIKTTGMKKMSNGGQKDPGKGGRIAGLATTISGAIGVGTKMLSDAIKKRRAVVQGAKALRKADPNLKRKESIKASQNAINNPTPEAKRGMSVKRKYQNGGSSQQGMYNTSSSGQNRTTSGSTYGGSPQAKRGGSIKSKTKK